MINKACWHTTNPKEYGDYIVTMEDDSDNGTSYYTEIGFWSGNDWFVEGSLTHRVVAYMDLPEPYSKHPQTKSVTISNEGIHYLIPIDDKNTVNITIPLSHVKQIALDVLDKGFNDSCISYYNQ